MYYICCWPLHSHAQALLHTSNSFNISSISLHCCCFTSHCPWVLLSLNLVPPGIGHVRYAHAVALESVIFDHVTPPEPPEPTMHPHCLCLAFAPLVSPIFHPCHQRLQIFLKQSSSFLHSTQNPLPKNSWIAHIRSADIKTQRHHRPMLYMLCAALTNCPNPLNLEGM